MLIYELEGIIKVFLEKENGLIIHEWLDYNPDGRDKDILVVLEKLYDLLIIYPVEKLIVKTDHTMGAFSPSIQEYIRVVQFPRLLTDTRIKYIATIKSRDLVAQISTDLWEDQLKAGSRLILHDVGSEDEARDWFKTIGQHNARLE